MITIILGSIFLIGGVFSLIMWFKVIEKESNCFGDIVFPVLMCALLIGLGSYIIFPQ